ncbi:MAG TPA: quinolinate synthase NadA [Candidatus Syntrophoarchaeum butanivorans]|uniref:Quinolinate synthase n=1 Tax=Candidatus Syntropharchaeum butanivorans TaxID=1839936 RepID=A0A7C1B5L7_9EURY|nr:quinolinate synthase NadA [Candidatus Syntrophoarchaeum butanivorans]HEC56515.1 quinolinate synthase NadA [Candidatus Syntrophoarchaeum butanivorans]
MQITGSIEELKSEKNGVILAHNYQRGEIQDIADFVGDSLELARRATETDADVIVFCGVDFMAETASILNPDKKVLIPDIGSICPMAQMLLVEDLIEAKKAHPEAEVVLYVNTLAEAKVYADCICTSANAEKIVDAMDADTILFGPDINLARYVMKRTRKQIIPVPEYGLCPSHHQISMSDLLDVKKAHPEAEVVVHPECVEEVQDMADHIASTSGMVRYCRSSDADEFLIGTEVGLLYRLRKEIPDKRFYPVSESAVCPQMKMHTLHKIERALREGVFEVKVPEEVRREAIKPIVRMLEISG